MQVRNLIPGFLACLMFSAAAMAQNAAPAAVTVDAGSRSGMSRRLFNVLFEKAIRTETDGPYAQMVRNGDFDAPGNGLAGWSYVAEGDAEGSMVLETAYPQDQHAPQSVKLTAMSLGKGCGIANTGLGGMKVEKGQWYDATFYARTTAGGGPRGGGGGPGSGGTVGLGFSLETPDGSRAFARTTLPEIGGDWRQYTVSLHAYDSSGAARLVISPIEPTIIWLDNISLVPRNPDIDPEAAPQVNKARQEPVLLKASAVAPVSAVAAMDGDELLIRLTNPSDAAVSAKIGITNAPVLSGEARITVQPDSAAAVGSLMKFIGAELSQNLPPHSATVLRLSAR